MRSFRWVISVLLVTAPALCQEPAARPEFEVASIRPSGPARPAQLDIGLHIDGARVSFTYLALKDYIGSAYQLKHYQISGPEWIASARFDIAAKLPAGTKRDQVPQMLQALLEDRFQMKAHREKKDFPVYALVVGKGGLKMKESPLDAEGGEAPGSVNVAASGGRGGVSVNYGRGASFTFGNNKFEARKLTMAVFIDSLGRFLDRPVVDMTDLKGTYDFTLDFSPEDFMAMQIRAAMAAGVVLPPEAMRALQYGSGDSMFAAVETLGLKLESRKEPLDVLVVDKIEKMPTEN